MEGLDCLLTFTGNRTYFLASGDKWRSMYLKALCHNNIIRLDCFVIASLVSIPNTMGNGSHMVCSVTVWCTNVYGHPSQLTLFLSQQEWKKIVFK